MGYDFMPSAKNDQPMHEDVTYELDQFPEDRTEKDLETHVAPADPRAHEGLSTLHPVAQKPVSDIEQGYMSATACILANLSMKLGRSIQWDHAKGAVVGDAEANQLLRRPYRAPVGASGTRHGLRGRTQMGVSRGNRPRCIEGCQPPTSYPAAFV